ncbi:MAG: aldehyde dehydrogenase [Gammaproteobacteria bacterium]
METIANYIDGRLVPPLGGRYLENFEPATGRVYSRVPASEREDIEAAVAAAQAAFSPWSRSTIDERAKMLSRLADALETRLDEFARAETIDNGKPLSLARSLDIPRVVVNLRFFASAITQFASESHAMGEQGFNYTLRQPLGAVACISPWNLPLYLFTWKIAPALAAGNTVVAKPSELTPMTAYLFSKLCIDIGLPPGVLNIVHGVGGEAGQALVEHPGIRAVSFTGGTATGEKIAAAGAPRFKRISLELGGKNPTIVFADCDRKKMLDAVVRSAFWNQGEVCLSGSRIFVERPYYQEFKDEVIRRAQRMTVGDPLEPETQQGALVSQAHLQKVLSYIELAQAEGGVLLCGGEQVRPAGRCQDGWFVEPTLFEGLAYDCRTNQEEIFGPVATLTPFADEAELLPWVNSTRYGLAASLWSWDINRCHRLARQIETGVVWVNCWMVRDLRTPFGGVKQSGVGREGGLEALRFFTEAKNVCVDIT